MAQKRSKAKRICIILVAIIQMGAFPMSSYATTEELSAPLEEAAPETDPSTANTVEGATQDEPQQSTDPTPPTPPIPPEPAQPTPPKAPEPAPPQPADPITGPSKPTGADSKSYTYNEVTGKWENEKYAWDPITKETTNKQPISFSFNEDTGLWEEKKWEYDPASQSYVPKVIATSKKAPTNERLTRDLQSIKNLGIDIDTDANITNNTHACSTSGDATVSQNLQVGDATSGSAYTMANVLNMLGSSWGNLGSDVSTFTTDINGNVTGDLYVNPSGVQAANRSSDNNLAINATASGSIYNDVVLCAKSGDASVHSNTKGGDARTGNADAVANLMNLINSTITSGNSFVGVMNIHGNFNGDILLPEHLRLGSILSPTPTPIAHTDKNSTISEEEAQLMANLFSHHNINNNIETIAQSGTADVLNNTTAGDAVSGDAQTNVTLLNLTNRDIIGNNGLLVFVNVLGVWVGFIVDAPAGSTTAALGSGISSNTSRTAGAVLMSEDYGITNNVTVAAETGDASMHSNNQGGSATTGNANASTNVLNLINSNLTMRDWFGILFINVFGSWDGSFGIDTESGNRAIAAMQKIAEDQAVPVQDAQVFRYIPDSDRANNAPRLQNITQSFTRSEKHAPELPHVTFASAQNVAPRINGISTAAVPSSNPNKSQQRLISALNFGAILTLSFLGIDQLSNVRKKFRRTNNDTGDSASS